MTLHRTHAEALDHADALAGFRERFVLNDQLRIYADGNSLGRLPHETVERIEAFVHEWGDRLVGGWEDWIELPVHIGDEIGDVIGARPGETLACDSTTINLYKLASAALDLAGEQRAVLVDDHDFPTNRYVLEGIAAGRGLELRRMTTNPIEGPAADDVTRAASAHDVGLVSLSHVSYRTGALADLPAITEAAHDAGAMVLWDLSHSAGAIPVRISDSGADLAVGCTYKYLNAGPGAPAFLFVRSDLQERMRSPVWGWFGQRDQFRMGARYEPAEGIERFLAGTPSILGLVAVLAGIELVLAAGLERVGEKAAALTEFLVALFDERLQPLGFRLNTPRDPMRRGAHVSLGHEDGWRLCRALIERAGVIPDFRPPDIVRLGFAPLYSRFVDVWDTVDRLARLVETGEYRQVAARPARVT
ncbi:MAG TPA: kynureninase [Gaiellaceae bacterium]|nr:kynureninase [Gaiellaceae bacterium]